MANPTDLTGYLRSFRELHHQALQIPAILCKGIRKPLHCYRETFCDVTNMHHLHLLSGGEKIQGDGCDGMIG